MTLTSPIAAWSIGGLEQPLLAALVAWATVQSYRLADGSGDARTVSRVGVLLGLAAITRPDGGLFTVTTCAALLLPLGFDRRMRRATGRIAAIAGVFFCGQVAFRRFYYGAWLPNTAHVKVAFTTARLSAGWQYVAGAEPYLWSLLLMALAATAVAMTQQASRRRVVIPIAGALVWTGYVVFIGGDYMPARRHLVPAIVLLSLVTAEGLDTLIKRRWVLKAEGTDPSSRALPLAAVAGVLAALCLAALARAQNDDPEKQHAMHDNWSWSGREVGGFLARAFAAERPLVAVDAAGSLPYFAPELPCLDMLGLNDRFIATHHPPGFGTGFIGHELGDGAYLLRRKPDSIAFHTPLGDKNAEWRGGKEMKQAPEFGQRYQLVTFETPEGVETLLWVRKEDGRIGVTRTELEVSVPGYLLSTPAGGVAELDAGGRVGMRIDGEHRADLAGLHLDPGQWEARVDASGDVDARMLAPIAARGDGSSQTEFTFEARESSPVKMSFTLRGGNRAHVRRVVFRKIVN